MIRDGFNSLAILYVCYINTLIYIQTPLDKIKQNHQNEMKHFYWKKIISLKGLHLLKYPIYHFR